MNKLAAQCNLRLEPQEVEDVRSNTAKIIEYIELLQSVDTEGVEPYCHTVERSSSVHAAAPHTLTPEEVLHNAPDKQGHFFTVPKMSV